MKKLNKFAFLAIGVVIGILIAMVPVAASASTGSQDILITYSNIRLYVDGSLITPKDVNGNIVEPFIYNGTTYLPVRALSEALGRNVSWDGKSSSVYIGAMPGTTQYFDQVMSAYQVSGYGSYNLASDTSAGYIQIAGVKYYHGVSQQTWAGGTTGFYNLNGQYTQFSGIYGPGDGTAQDCAIKFYGDGQLISSFEFSPGDMPKDFSINLTGVLQLKIELDGGCASIVNWQIQ